jgi:hypothetical protein
MALVASLINLIVAVLAILMMSGSPLPEYLPSVGPWTIFGIFLLSCSVVIISAEIRLNEGGLSGGAPGKKPG